MTNIYPYPWTARLSRLYERTAIEKKADALAKEIEELGADPKLTEAMMYVHAALLTLGAWHDEGEPGRIPKRDDRPEPKEWR